MRPLALIVTGAPASGKTTLGRPLAAALGLPYFSKDMLKECLFDILGIRDREWSRQLGGASMQLLYRCAEAILAAGQSVALECNFYPEWDTPKLRELQARVRCRFVQVLCVADGPTLVARFETRAVSGKRHPGHFDASSLDEFRPKLVSEHWDALDLDGPVFTLDTTTGKPFDVDELARQIRTFI